MASQGRLFYGCRRILRVKYRHYRIETTQEQKRPVVYVCRHRSAIGPIASLCVLPVGIRPWVLSTFFDKDECVRHCRDYTFPIAWGVKKPFVVPLSVLICGPFTALVRSTAAIPVYRNSMKVRWTFTMSMEALENGESLLIFPDVNYDEKNGKTGDLYEGFLLLDQMWYRKKKEHIRFVPLNISTRNRCLTVGEVVSFPGVKSYREEKDDVAARIQTVFDEMAEKYGT